MPRGRVAEGSGVVDVSVIVACYNGAGDARRDAREPDRPGLGRILRDPARDNGSTDASAAIFAAIARAASRGRGCGGSTPRPSAARPTRSTPASRRRRAAPSSSATPTTRCRRAGSPPWAAALERHDFVAARLDTAPLNHGLGRRPTATGPGSTARPAPADPCAPLPDRRRRRARLHPPGLHEAVGGFDPAFAVQEDHDFCIRAHLAGFELVPVPETRYNYRFRDDFGGIYRQAYAYARYRALLRRRYAPEPLLSPAPWLEPRPADPAARRCAGAGGARMPRRGGAPAARAGALQRHARPGARRGRRRHRLPGAAPPRRRAGSPARHAADGPA